MSEVDLAVNGGTPLRHRPFPKWPRATDASRTALIDVLESGNWWQSGGGEAERFEEWLADYLGVAGAVAVANGTQALELAYKALGVSEGDEVLIPATTFISTASAAVAIGAVPVPVDIREDTLCIDVEAAETNVTSRTKLIVPVHLAGQPADLDGVNCLAASHELGVVEDNAQGLGAEWLNKKAGSLGDMATFSFQAAKLLSGGEGGAITVQADEGLVEQLRLLANCGRRRGSSSYDHQMFASNCRMTEFQAALLLSQLPEYDNLMAQRNTAAFALQNRLVADGWVKPMLVDSRVTTMPWYMFIFWMPEVLRGHVDNHEFASALTAEGIPANPLYPGFHLTNAYKAKFGIPIWPVPVAERASKEAIWLHHRLLLDSEQGVADIALAIAKVSEAMIGRAK